MNDTMEAQSIFFLCFKYCYSVHGLGCSAVQGCPLPSVTLEGAARAALGLSL